MSLFWILSTSQNLFKNGARNLLFDIVSGIFHLVENAFDLFFDITNYTFLENELAKGLFNRLFIIIGAFMLFKLLFSIISYLLNPDAMNDKERGVGKLVARVITMLILLYVLMPMDSFELWGTNTQEQINKNKLYQSNGLLFGALYDFQERVINDGAISQLILGKKLNISSGKNVNEEYKIGQNISFVILRAFFNVSDACTEAEVTSDDDISTIDDLEAIVNATCGKGTKTVYTYEFNGIVALLVGLGVAVIVFLFCFDVAIRMIKLGILRLLSPIAAISYIDPKSSKDGAFANYVKVLTSTYLELFLRLAIIYLVIFIIANIAKNDVNMFSTTSKHSEALAKPIIYIALLFFAGQAPRFIQQALGIKSKGTGLGFGAAMLGGALSGAVSGFATGGVWGGLRGIVGGANAGTQNQWARQNGQNPGASARQSARDNVAQTMTGDRNARGQSLSNLIAGRTGNAIMGRGRKAVDRSKGNMYFMEGKVRSAQDDFTNNTDGVVGNMKYGTKWSTLAKQDKQAVLDATDALAQEQARLEEYRIAISGGDDSYMGIFKAQQSIVSQKESELTAAKNRQATHLAEYTNYVNAEYGKIKKHYEVGDQNLQRTDPYYTYKGKPKLMGDHGEQNARYNRFDDHHPHT